MTKKYKIRIQDKKYFLFMAMVAILAVVFILRLVGCSDGESYSSKKVKSNLSAISDFDFSEVEEVEKEIQALAKKEIRKSLNLDKPLSNEKYKQIFSGSMVIGDSITEGLSVYGFLDDDEVVCKIGASIINGDDMFDTVAGNYPIAAFFSFGMNDMGNFRGDADAFIKKYKSLLKSFKSKSPDTSIYVNLISTPGDTAISSNPTLKNYKSFNKAIIKMCNELKITYIDNSFILEEHPEYRYGDGIHVSTNYYPIWLNNMIFKAGL